MRRLRILSAVAGIALIAACGSNDSDDGTTTVPEDGSGTSESEEPASVVSTKWILQDVTTADASLESSGDDSAGWLQINEAGEVSGSTGCNGFGGSAEVGDGVVTFEPLLATKKACSGDVGQIDTAMLSVLRGEVTAEVSGDSLTLTNTKDETLTLTVGEVPSSES